MKIRSTQTTPIAPCKASDSPLRTGIPEFIGRKAATLLTVCGIFATAAVSGQTVRNWTGGNGAGIELGAATNWSGGVLPGNGDTAQWDGLVAGNLSLTYNGGIGGNYQVTGTSYSLTPNQTGSVTIRSSVSSSPALSVNHLTNSSATAAFSFGDATANVFNIQWRADGGNPPYNPHYLINDSASAATINSNVKFSAGGGNPHTLIFSGSGNWIITNTMTTANGVGTTIAKQGSGTLTWSGPSISGALGNSVINSPVDIEGGTVVLRNGNPLTTQSITNNGTLLQYDAPSQSQTLSGIIRGTGLLQVNNGTLTLSGSSSYSGSTILSGGTLVLGSAHTPGVSGPIGVGGTISFNGGTMQFSVNNTFDYSSRFSTAASQVYKFDTAGQSVTFATGLSSSGGSLTKSGAGTLTLSGTSSYSGLTTVSAGKLVFQGANTGSGDITVANSTILGVTETGAQVTPATLTLGTSSSVTLEFNSVSSTTTPIVAAGTISAGGVTTVNVNSGTFAIGQSYPLLSWTSGSPTFVLGTLTGAGGNLSVSGNTLYLNITSLAFVWTGLSNGNWDTTTANNWTVNGVSQVFANGGTALFDDTASGEANVLLNSPVSPASVTVNSSAKVYSIISNGANLIGGTGGLTKSGNSVLTLVGGVNTYSGVTTISGGTLSVSTLANGGAPSDIGAASGSAANLVFNGGALQYTNGNAATVDRLFTVGTGGGLIDASGLGALALNNTGAIGLSGSGARTFTLSGSTVDENTLAASLGDNGGATSLAKTGPGKWIVTGNNSNSGPVTVSAGTLQVGAGGASGSIGTGAVTLNGSSSLIFNRIGTLTNSVISGTGSMTVDGGGTVVLPGNSTYTGGTTINAGTLQVGAGEASGSLSSSSPISNNGTVIFNSTGDFSIGGYAAIISGSGNLIKRGSGLLAIIGNNTYSGWTTIDPGAALQVCDGNQGQFASPVVTNNGSLVMDRQDTGMFIYAGEIVGSGSLTKKVHNGNAGDVTLTGNSSYTGGTYILGGTIILGDGTTTGAGSIVGNVYLTNDYVHAQFGPYVPAMLTFNRPDDLTFAGDIVGDGSVTHQGGGVLTLTGNNTYTNGTTIDTGVLQVGNGGANGSIGIGNIADGGTLVFNRSGSLTYNGRISGSGSVVKTGSGTVTLSTNTYAGSTTVSNGTLIVNGDNASSATYVYGGTLGGSGTFSGPITLDAGTTLAPGASVGTFTVNNNLTIGGNVAVELNKSLAQSNDLVVVTGTLSKTGSGTLTVTNLGSSLAVGDRFVLFSQPLQNGVALTVTGAGATWQNDLAVDGSITALTVPAPSVNTNPPVVQVSISGNTMALAWPTNRGWTLQTNSVGLTSANQWFSYPGSESITNVTIAINPAKTNVFFRMVYTNTP